MKTEAGEGQYPNFFLPMLLMWLAVLVWFGFQSYQLLKERDNLATLSGNQEAIYQNAQKMRGQLDAIAAGTQRLAKAGTPNAVLIVSELARRGITINPDAEGAKPGK